MGIPTSEVGYTSATTGREDHEIHKGYVVALVKKNAIFLLAVTFCGLRDFENCRKMYYLFSVIDDLF
jgi:hypothetical protein